MFETEAEYRKAKAECKAKITKVIKVWNAEEETIHDVSFKDGTAYGYNQASVQIDKMKMCCNCKKWRAVGEQLDHISYPCHQHNCDDVCPIWELWER